MATISLITVNYNGRHFLGELFTSLAAQTRPADQVILVDNGSTDGSVAYVAARFPWVEIVALERNVGYAAGNNAGLARASGELIALLNSDTTVEPRWLASLEAALERDPGRGVAVAKILLAGTSPPRLDCAGAEFNSIGFCWGRGANQIDRGQFEREEEVAGLTACALLLRRSCLQGGPLFDPAFYLYYEEADLTFRVRGAGYGIVYAPAAIVHHKRSQSVRAADDAPILFQQFYGNRNRAKILAKFYPAGVLLRNLPLIAASLLYWDVVFLRRKGPRHALRALGAQLAFARRGWRERSAATRSGAPLWRPWMITQSVREIRALRATFLESAPPAAERDDTPRSRAA